MDCTLLNNYHTKKKLLGRVTLESYLFISTIKIKCILLVNYC
jgi:hypothetical protein